MQPDSKDLRFKVTAPVRITTKTGQEMIVQIDVQKDLTWSEAKALRKTNRSYSIVRQYPTPI